MALWGEWALLGGVPAGSLHLPSWAPPVRLRVGGRRHPEPLPISLGDRTQNKIWGHWRKTRNQTWAQSAPDGPQDPSASVTGKEREMRSQAPAKGCPPQGPGCGRCPRPSPASAWPSPGTG